jgi:hypothetical protein
MTDLQKQKDLFNRAVQINTEKLVLAQDLKSLKDEFTYDKDANIGGLSKDQVKNITKAAALHAKEQFEAFTGEAKALMELYEQLVD